MDPATSTTVIALSLGELGAILLVVVGAYWGLGKMLVSQFTQRMEEKFAANKSNLDTKIDEIGKKLASFDTLHTELSRVDKDLIQVRLEMAQNFVRQEGLRRLELRMEELFREAFNKLEAKADKSECVRFHQLGQ